MGALRRSLPVAVAVAVVSCVSTLDIRRQALPDGSRHRSETTSSMTSDVRHRDAGNAWLAVKLSSVPLAVAQTLAEAHPPKFASGRRVDLHEPP